ncbi:hypothetical protein BVY03_03645 [bacterium K02(2017)]|nr:hypothetical protein BVY03_03645 [bacterium K02(2017)]
MFNNIIKTLATWFGLGLVPLAPGTFGTIGGSLFYYFFRHHSIEWMIQFSLIFAAFSIFVAHMAEKVYKEKDCQKIVIDEVAGVLFCYACLPYSHFNLVMGFILFRIFDVAKLPPARQAQDNLKGGWGVVCDDLVAGIQAGLILYFLPNMISYASSSLAWLEKMIS